MKIRNIMTTDVTSITPDTTYAEAAKLMHEHTIASIPVTDKTGTLVGILSEKDLFIELYPKYDEFYENTHLARRQEEMEDKVNDLRVKPISNYMTKKVLTIGSDDPIMKAGGIMLARHIHRLPVVDERKFIGIVSREDVFSAVLKFHLGF